MRALLIHFQYRDLIDAVVLVISDVVCHFVSAKYCFCGRSDDLPKAEGCHIRNSMQKRPACSCRGTIPLHKPEYFVLSAISIFTYSGGAKLGQ